MFADHGRHALQLLGRGQLRGHRAADGVGGGDAVVHRGRHTRHPDRAVFPFGRPAARAGLVQRRVEFGAVGDGVVGEGLQLGGQQGVHLGLGEVGQQHLAQRRDVNGEAAADARHHAHGVAGLAAGQIDDVGVVAAGVVDGVADLGANVLKGVCGVGQRGVAVEVGGARQQGVGAHAERRARLVGLDPPEFPQGAHQGVQAGTRVAHPLLQLRQAEPGGGVGQRLQNPDGAFGGLHRWIFGAWHACSQGY